MGQERLLHERNPSLALATNARLENVLSYGSRSVTANHVSEINALRIKGVGIFG